MRIRILLVIGLYFGRLALTFSQNVQFEFINDKDGLVSNQVNCMLKDYKGYMWVGTFNGLSRYNGYEFINYVNNPADNNSLSDNYVRTIFESKSHVLYIGLEYKGLCIFNRQTETFKKFQHNKDDSNSLINDGIIDFCEDSSGNLWIATRGGLDKFDPVTEKFTHYKPYPENGSIISSVVYDGKGSLWLYGPSSKICHFDLSNQTFSYIKFTEYFNISEFYRGGTLWLDSHNNLWIGTEPNGLFRYNTITKAIDEFSIRTKALTSDKIFSITEDSDHSIWIGTDGGGLYEYRYSGNKLFSYKHDDENPRSLSSNAVFAVYESDPGVLWVSIYASGLNIYKKNKNKFISYSPNFKPGTGISQKSVLSLAQAEGNKVWVGTDGGGLNLFDPEKQSFQYFTTSNSSINSNIIKSMLKDKAGNLWLGSYAGGMAKVNFRQGISTHFVANPHTTGNELLNANVWSLCESSDGKIWIGFIGFGLQVYDKTLKRFTYHPFDSVASSKGTCNIHVIFEDSRKRIWIGSQGAGIGYYDPLLKNFVRVSLNTLDHKGIDINEIGSIFEDAQHTIWLGTSRSGLVKIIDLSKGFAESYTMKDGLASSKVVSVQEDDHHNLWLGTSNGICRFNPSTRQVINFDKEDGLVNKEYNYNSSLKSTDGKLYFGGMYGLDVFHPDSMVFNTTMPKVEITELKIFNQVIHPNQTHNGRTYLDEDISLTKTLVLTHNDYVFSLDFAALDYISPNKNKYAYRLMGFHNEWTYVGANKRSVTYTNLDPGEYTFNVIASNNDGKWNKTGAMLKIRVLPPWWETWWFRIGALMLFLASFIVFYYLRLRSIKERNRILKTEVKNQTAQLSEINKELLHQKVELENKTIELESANKTKDKFFSIVAHDLKGPISALSFLTNTLNKEYLTMPATTHQEFIGHIDNSAIQLKKLVLNLLEWARTQTKQASVKPERISVNELLQSNIKLLQEQASQKGIEMSIETREDHFVLADYNMVNTVIRNIISNGIKYSRKGGKIKSYHKDVLR